MEYEPFTLPLAVGQNLVVGLEDIDSRKASIVGLSIDAGIEVWKLEADEGISSPAAIDEGGVIVGVGRAVRRIEGRDGAHVWRAPTEDSFDPLSVPAVAFGDVFLADRIGNIYRLDGETGERMWTFGDTEGTFEQSSPVVAGKTLYIGSSAGNLYGVDVDSGELVWEDKVDGFVLSGAADEDHFYFGVKFGEQGLYAYGHDPDGGASDDGNSLVGWLIILAVVLGGIFVWLRVRSRSGRQPGSAASP